MALRTGVPNISKKLKFLLKSILGLTLLWGPAVSAEPVDAIADQVFGQPDFTSRTPNNGGLSNGLNDPVGVAVDLAGNVFVADTRNNRVLVYFDPQNTDNIPDFVLGQPDFNSNVHNYGGITFGAVNAIGLSKPNDVAVDTAGNVYVSDLNNHRVLGFIDPLNTDKVADIVIGQSDFTSSNPNNGGLSASSLMPPTGVAVDTAGNLYVVDINNHRVLKYNTPITEDNVADEVFGQPDFISNGCDSPAGISSANNLCSPRNVAIDSSGNVYITDQGNHRVLVYLDPATDKTADIVLGQPGFDWSNPNFPGCSGSFPTTTCGNRLWAPHGVVVDVKGNVYVADLNNRRILVYKPPLTTDMNADIVLGQPDFTTNTDNNGGVSASSLSTPYGLALDAAGSLYVADGFNNRVLGYGGTLPIVVLEADAGPDQSENEGLLVTLDGSASTNATNYAWTQLAGPIVSLSDATAVNPEFTTPFVATNTTLTFRLIVDDGQGNSSDPDTVDITVVSVNNPPTADAGDDGTVKEGAVATLDGSNSFDPEGDTPLEYLWTQTGGPAVTLSDNTEVSPTFTAPTGIGSILEFELEVGDGKETSQPDEVKITIVENSQPVADAGPDQTVDEGSPVALNGNGSSDPDGDGLAFDWTEPVALDDDMVSTPTFTAPSAGPGGSALTFSLVVTDDDPVNPKSSTADQVVINVRNINDPPSCDLARAVCPDSKIKGNDSCMIWPPNHKLVEVNIEGVTDADAEYNNVTLQITGVTQDEPVNGGGDGDTGPDAVIQDNSETDSVLIRAERSGNNNGRVYQVNFTASDSFESCDGSVTVGVPHDRKDTPVDDGQNFDSTQLP